MVHLEDPEQMTKLTAWKKQRPEMTLQSVLPNSGKTTFGLALYETRETQKSQADKANCNPQKKKRLFQPDRKCGSPGRCLEAGLFSKWCLWLTIAKIVNVAKSLNGFKAQIMHNWCPL